MPCVCLACAISLFGFPLLTEVVSICTDTILSLDVSWNKLGPEGCELVARAFRRNKVLQSLNLAGNDIGRSGCEELAIAMKNNDSLTCLNISFNGIGHLGIIALADVIKKGKRSVGCFVFHVGLRAVVLTSSFPYFATTEQRHQKTQCQVERHRGCRSYGLR